MDCIDKATGMMTDQLIAVLQDPNSSNQMATKHFLITRMLFDRQITTVQ